MNKNKEEKNKLSKIKKDIEFQIGRMTEDDILSRWEHLKNVKRELGSHNITCNDEISIEK